MAAISAPTPAPTSATTRATGLAQGPSSTFKLSRASPYPEANPRDDFPENTTNEESSFLEKAQQLSLQKENSSVSSSSRYATPAVAAANKRPNSVQVRHAKLARFVFSLSLSFTLQYQLLTTHLLNKHRRAAEQHPTHNLRRWSRGSLSVSFREGP